MNIQLDSPAIKIEPHLSYRFYLRTLNETISNEIDLISQDIQDLFLSILPFFKQTINLELFKSLYHQSPDNIVKTLLMILKTLSNCLCCDTYQSGQLDIVAQILHFMLLEIYVYHFDKSVKITHDWNKGIREAGDINAFIVKNYHMYSLYRYNNEIITQSLFK